MNPADLLPPGIEIEDAITGLAEIGRASCRERV